ncbi:MAG TPA: hypothetical protein VGF52_05030 [Tepidisphaeraceae bacterium]|jgi:hypothetical protein
MMRKWFGYCLFIAWFGVVSLIIAATMGLHAAPLPQTRIASRPSLAADGRWQLIHVLVADCGCSRIVAQHLADRGPLADASEKIWLVGDNSQMSQKLQAHNFPVQPTDPEFLTTHFGINGGPWLLVIDPHGQVVYSGGYAPTLIRFASDPREKEILQNAKNGKVDVYPAFGCASSKWLKDATDPLGIK